MHWVALIVVGFVVGGFGRFFHPGPDPMGWLTMFGLGIASLVIAGALFSSDVLQFAIGVVVAVVLVAIYGRVAHSTRELGPT
jgi:uncharacterized membrane protein YeaQ/YmgE (transglycosylase-associated protein family)